jgi:hypothetical protein
VYFWIGGVQRPPAFVASLLSVYTGLAIEFAGMVDDIVI